jgi:hypothetical protein
MYPRDFLEWLRFNCKTQIGLRTDKYDIFWVLIKDLNPWDEMAKTLYTLDEIYAYWQEHPENYEMI